MTRRSRIAAAALLASALVVGGLAGVLAGELLDDVNWPAALGGDRAEDDIDDGDDLDDEDDLLGRLDLDASQRRRIEAILEGREERLESWWRARLPEVRALVEESRNEIRAVLTPAQRVEFDRRAARAAPDLDDATD